MSQPIKVDFFIRVNIFLVGCSVGQVAWAALCCCLKLPLFKVVLHFNKNEAVFHLQKIEFVFQCKKLRSSSIFKKIVVGGWCGGV
jgi:hypothetical protein